MGTMSLSVLLYLVVLCVGHLVIALMLAWDLTMAGFSSIVV